MSTDDHLSEASASPPPPPPASSPARDFPTPAPASDSPTIEWFGRLELSGKLLLFGGVAGVIFAYFPLISVSAELAELLVIDFWQGTFSVLAYLAAIVLAVVLHPPDRTADRRFVWAALGVGTVLVLLAVWLFISAARVGIGIGAVLNVFAAGTVAAGAVMKAREERVI